MAPPAIAGAITVHELYERLAFGVYELEGDGEVVLAATDASTGSNHRRRYPRRDGVYALYRQFERELHDARRGCYLARGVRLNEDELVVQQWLFLIRLFVDIHVLYDLQE